MHGRPAIGTVADVGRRPVLAGEADQRRHEAVGVERAVHGRRQPDGRGPDPAPGQGDQGVLGVDPWPAGEHIRLGAGPAQPGEGEQQRPGGDDEGLAAAGEHIPDRLDGPLVGLDRAGEITGLHRLVLERQVHDSVGAGRGVLQPGGVVELAAVHLGAGGGQRGRGGVRAGQPDDLVAGGQQLRDEGGPEVPRCSGDEDAHDVSLSRWQWLSSTVQGDVSTCHRGR